MVLEFPKFLKILKTPPIWIYAFAIYEAKYIKMKKIARRTIVAKGNNFLARIYMFLDSWYQLVNHC